MKTGVIISLAVILILGGATFLLTLDSPQSYLFRPNQPTAEPVETPGVVSATITPQPDTINRAMEVVAQGLDIPWEIVWLPGGDMLVTQRTGSLMRIGEDQQAIPVEGVEHVGEGGLLGMALHPEFSENSFVYLYLTTETLNGLQNRVERYRLEGITLSGREIIFEGIPGARFHDGGRIAFGPDGYLYVTTGDAGNEQAAQDTSGVAGKILRITDTGGIPADNPFGNAVYSYGHRNPQGLAWDDTGRLWATEHGRSGVASGFDEVNLIIRGGNYGWPEIQGNETAAGMIPPAAHSGADVTWAPGGAVFLDGSLWFAGLRGESLYEAVIRGDQVESVTPHLTSEYGRLRSVSVGPDGALYVLTSNQDGRGRPQEGDDKVIRIDSLKI